MQVTRLRRGRADKRTPLLVASAILPFLAVYGVVYGFSFANRHFVDANSYWVAAQMSFLEGVSPYGDAFDAASAASPAGFAHPFVYPPPSLALFAPFALLDYHPSTLVLLAASHAAMLVTFAGLALASWGTLRPPGTADALVFVVCVVLVASAQASRVTLGIGQINFFALAGLVFFWAAILGHANRWIGAAGLLLLALLKPYFAAVGLVVLLPAGRHMLGPSLVTAMGSVVVSLAMFPASFWSDWITGYLLPMAGESDYLGRYHYASLLNNNLAAALQNAPGLGPGAATFHAVGAAVAILLQGLALARHRRDAGRLTLPAMATLPLVFLLAPYSWSHYLVYCAVAAAMVALSSTVRREWIPLLAAIALLLVLLQPTALPLLEWAVVYLPTFAVAAFWLVAITWSLWQPSGRRLITSQA